MTPRTLTAGKENNSSQRYLPEAYQEETIQFVWHMIAQLWRLGERWAAVGPEQRRLRDKTIAMCAWLQRHPDHPEAVERRARYEQLWAKEQRLKAEVDTIEGEAASLRANLARHLDRLPKRRLAELRSEPSWPSASSSSRTVAELWERAQRRGTYPAGERF
jgi:hypothetical protein